MVNQLLGKMGLMQKGYYFIDVTNVWGSLLEACE
jgi:hypothetical protein